MLPISRHRTLIIPHRLALIAAAVCLALSFTADRSDVGGKLQAGGDQPVEQLEAVNGGSVSLAPGEKPVESRPTNRRDLRLLPWFSGLAR